MANLKLKKQIKKINPEPYVPETITDEFGGELNLGTWTENEVLDHYSCDMNESWD